MESILIRIENLDALKGYPIVLLRDPFDNPAELTRVWLPKSVLNTANRMPQEMKQFVLETPHASEEFQAIGETLFAWFAQGDVYDKWLSLKRQCSEKGLRTLLEVRADDLAQAPWELLCQTTNGLAETLFTQPKYPFARFHGNASRSLSSVDLPIRILIIVGSKPDDSEVNAEQELKAINRELIAFGHSMDLEILERPTRSQLLEKLEDFVPHIFHFIGHGTEDPLNQQGVLQFTLDSENSQGEKTWQWNAGDIFRDIKALSWQPRIVFLNACRTGAIEYNRLAVMQAFLQAEVPAIIGMQADIRADLVGEFAAKIYSGLAKGEAIDTLVAQLRQTLLQANIQGEGFRMRDWALPMLSLAIDPNRIMPCRHQLDPVMEFRIKQCPIFEKQKQFVNCRKERRAVHRSFHPLPKNVEAKPNYLLVITGEDKIGKSSLIKWCMEGCALQNHIVRYIEIADKEPKNILDFVRMIRDGDQTKQAESLLHEPLPKKAFYEFNWMLNQLLEVGVKVPWDNSPTCDKKIRLEEARTVSPEDILKSFCVALESAAGNTDLVLVIDKAGDDNISIAPSFFKQILLPNFVLPIASGGYPHVKLVLVFNSKDVKEYGLEQLQPISSSILLKAWSRSQFNKLVEEFFWYPNLCLEQENLDQEEQENLDKKNLGLLRDFAIRLSKMLPDPWKPEELVYLNEIVTSTYKRYGLGEPHLQAVRRMQ